ncbi:NnrU family protein [Sphingosinicella rhizophila]|uniref:NnrU family protein n=1 Tax=Sphingosinicella rhizophila TaxID=3050082 RepID=A0ABU3Q4D4_9SPHN|nr:NnrU family protein [Sphingosinicella sp. GR2756]MDT9598282.1 NnrU family protein [Sphingosinicella sp. GR2756]
MIEHVSLALATLAFIGSHLAMSHPLRTRLVQNLGEAGFALLHSLIAFATLGWMIVAWRGINAPVPMWIAPLWWWNVASAIMLLACILLVGSLFRNPAFPNAGARKPAMRPATGVFAITRHPMNWSFILWALVHISLWWSPRNLIVAMGILILAIAGSIGQDRKKRALLGEGWRGWESRTSFIPFRALIDGRIPWRAAFPGWTALLGGLALWLAITWFHAPMVSPIGGLGRGIG